MSSSIQNLNFDLLKSINYCDLPNFKEYFSHADLSEQNLSLRQVLESKCSIETKKNMMEELYSKGIKASGINTMLALSILNKNKDLISFAFDRVSDFTGEDISLLYALQEKDCGTALKLLKAGVNITDDVMDNITDNDVKLACSDIQHLQQLNSSLSTSNDNIIRGFYEIEVGILIGHNLCSDFL